MKRRQMLKVASAAVVGLSAFPLGWVTAAPPKKQRVLYFTRSAGFVHSVVNRNGSPLSHSEKELAAMGKWGGIEVECSQDGTVFDGNLDQYDAIAFFTSGDLCMPRRNGQADDARGKQKLLDAIAAGKGFVGFHACTDSFRSKGEQVDPYTAMVGAEFLTHGPQQEASLVITSQFPGTKGLCMAEGISFTEEWYAQKNFSRDLHVILVPGDEVHAGRMLPPPRLPLHVGARAGKGPRVLHLAGAPRGDLDRSVLPGDRDGRFCLGLGQCRPQRDAEHQAGNPQSQPVACLARAVFQEITDGSRRCDAT